MKKSSTITRGGTSKMWNCPTQDDLQNIPALYGTEKIEVQEKMIHMHFFLGGCDWYVSEYQEENQIFFGYVILNNDLEMSEWGYFSLSELEEIKIGGFLEIDRDLHFQPKPAKEIEKIRKANSHW